MEKLENIKKVFDICDLVKLGEWIVNMDEYYVLLYCWRIYCPKQYIDIFVVTSNLYEDKHCWASVTAAQCRHLV